MRRLAAFECAALGLAWRDADGWHSKGRLLLNGIKRGTIDEHGELADGVKLDVMVLQLADVDCPIARSHVGALLNGDARPSIDVAAGLERAFRIPASAWALAPDPLAMDLEASPIAEARRSEMEIGDHDDADRPEERQASPDRRGRAPAAVRAAGAGVGEPLRRARVPLVDDEGPERPAGRAGRIRQVVAGRR
jgi:hypothetical protein